MNLEIEGSFTLFGAVPNNIWNDLLRAIESVPKSIFYDEHNQPLKTEIPLDKKIADSLNKWEVIRNYKFLPGSNFTVDLASEKYKILVEIEKGQLPRLELDIIKIMSASSLGTPPWKFGALIVPATHIKMKLVTNTTPYKYLEKLKPLIQVLIKKKNPLEGFIVIGYKDPRST